MNYEDFDRYTLGEIIDTFFYDDGSHSSNRRRELNRRKYAGCDYYYGNPDNLHADWC